MSDARTLPSKQPPAELREVGRGLGAREEIAQLWQRREFIVGLSSDTLRATNMHTFLGNFWQLLNPALQIFVYWLIFAQVLDVSRGTDNFITFLAAGLFFYRYTTSSLTNGARSIRRNGGLIRTISFPRMLLPVASTLTETISHSFAFVVMLSVLIMGGETPGPLWLLVLPLLMVQIAFNLGGALILARLNNRFPDIQNFLTFFFRLLFYASGILFVFENRIQNETAQTIVELNPIYGMVTTYRWILLDMGFNLTAFISFCVWSVVLLVSGFVYFRRGETEYGTL